MKQYKSKDSSHNFICNIKVYNGGKSRLVDGFQIYSDKPIDPIKKLKSILDFVFSDVLDVEKTSPKGQWDVFETKKVYGDWFIVLRNQSDFENPVFIQINRVKK